MAEARNWIVCSGEITWVMGRQVGGWRRGREVGGERIGWEGRRKERENRERRGEGKLRNEMDPEK